MATRTMLVTDLGPEIEIIIIVYYAKMANNAGLCTHKENCPKTAVNALYHCSNTTLIEKRGR